MRCGETSVIDPRESVIDERLSLCRRIVAVTGGKGGVGKSLVSAGLALRAADSGLKTGLLDLDITTPAQHLILGFDGEFPEEERGLVPPLFHGVRFMSLSHFSGEGPAALRGRDISSAIIEMLAITLWGELDLLVIDMPPGMSDAVLDVLRLIPRAESLMVCGPSKVSFSAVEKMIVLLRQVKAPVLGVLGNMTRRGCTFVRESTERFGAAHLGDIPFDEELEARIGDPDRLLRSAAVRGLEVVRGVMGECVAAGGRP